jgi:hypothetical protein
MLAVNQQSPGHVNVETTIVDFWEKTYFPYATENLRHPTRHAYTQIWSHHLKAHFGELRFA